jgi:phenylalanyl-tRNA synthetase beta chain
MKVTLNWLKEYVDFPWTANQLADHLTMLGLEVESIQPIAGEFEGVVVAQVITRDKHPNADKLSVCRVQDGQGERQIVCGAHNFQPGDKVPLILPGATLPTQPGAAPFTIKVGKIRGVESHGMMCSGMELGLNADAEGLLILKPEAPVGQPFAQYLGRTAGDAVLDLEITPNRPDLNSVIGIAREIAAQTGNPLRLPHTPTPSPDLAAPELNLLAAVQLEAPDLCPRYTARLVRNVTIAPSPDWLRSRLEKVGIRAINNVVDVTNYVMVETGQPLHAFDYHLIAPGPNGVPTITVRRAHPNESFTTLDNQTHALSPDMLLIADPARGVALAGVMGGANTEIHDTTTEVLLESAWFLPTNIRRTSKQLGLRTDASYRFERGVDIGATAWASLRAAQLIVQIAGGQLLPTLLDAYPQPFVPKQVTLRHAQANALLGLELPPETMECHLAALGLKIAQRKPRPVDLAHPTPDPVTFTIPTWRPDLKREIDLIEEIARLHGVDRIPSTPPRGAIGTNDYDTRHDQITQARQLLTGLGLHEAQGQTLIPEAAAHLVTPTPVLLSNPLSSDMNALRPSLLPGLLDSLGHNLSHQNPNVALFEIGRVFARNLSHPAEQHRLAIALCGLRAPPFWKGADRDARFDLLDLKGLLEEFLEHFGLRGLVFVPRESPTPLFVQSAEITLGGKITLGELGQLLPNLVRQYDLRDAALLAELNLDELLGRRITTRTFSPLPAFPAVRRDLALILPESVSHDAILRTVRQTRTPNLQSVELFDIFRGKPVPTGQKSVAYALTYRHASRTLTDAEVNAAQEKLISHLRQQLGATLRE